MTKNRRDLRSKIEGIYEGVGWEKLNPDEPVYYIPCASLSVMSGVCHSQGMTYMWGIGEKGWGTEHWSSSLRCQEATRELWVLREWWHDRTKELFTGRKTPWKSKIGRATGENNTISCRYKTRKGQVRHSRIPSLGGADLRYVGSLTSFIPSH